METHAHTMNCSVMLFVFLSQYYAGSDSPQSEGTADMDEFDTGLRYEHSKHEQEYTSDVFDSYNVLDWDAEIESAVEGSRIDNFSEIHMSSKFKSGVPARSFSNLMIPEFTRCAMNSL